MIDPDPTAGSSVWIALGTAGVLMGTAVAVAFGGMAVHRWRGLRDAGAEARRAPPLLAAAAVIVIGAVVALIVGLATGWAPFDVSNGAAQDLVGRRPGGIIILAVLALVAVATGAAVYRWLSWRESVTGSPSYPTASGIAAGVAAGAVGWVVISAVAGEAPYGISYPAPDEGTFGRIGGGFDVVSGLIALLVGLVIYTSSFIAEIVRAGVQSVGRGQTEAGRSVGLTGSKTLRYVTFPQALPVIIPRLSASG